MKHAEQRIVVAGTTEECFDALLDYEGFPQWQRAVKSTEIESRDEAGRGRDVAFEIDAKVKTIRYRLRYSYEPPHRISWEYLGGDVKEVDGEMLLEEHDNGTLVTYSLALDPGVWLPGPVQKVLNDQVMKGSLEDLKRRVESDHS